MNDLNVENMLRKNRKLRRKVETQETELADLMTKLLRKKSQVESYEKSLLDAMNQIGEFDKQITQLKEENERAREIIGIYNDQVLDNTCRRTFDRQINETLMRELGIGIGRISPAKRNRYCSACGRMTMISYWSQYMAAMEAYKVLIAQHVRARNMLDDAAEMYSREFESHIPLWMVNLRDELKSKNSEPYIPPKVSERFPSAPAAPPGAGQGYSAAFAPKSPTKSFSYQIGPFEIPTKSSRHFSDAIVLPAIHVVLDNLVELNYYHAETRLKTCDGVTSLEIITYSEPNVRSAVWIDTDSIQWIRVDKNKHESNYIWEKIETPASNEQGKSGDGKADPPCYNCEDYDSIREGRCNDWRICGDYQRWLKRKVGGDD